MAKPLTIKLADLAVLGIEGLPSTRQGLHALAERSGWPVAGQARGGAYLYEVTGALALNILKARQARINKLMPKPRAASASICQERARGRPKGSDYFTQNPDIADVVRLMLYEGKPPVSTVLKALATQYPAYPLPSLRVTQRFIALIEKREKAAIMLIRDPDAYNSKVRLSLGRADGGYTYAHQGWEVDTTPTDVLLIDDEGRPARFAILGVIDVWSRRVRFVLAKSECAQSVRALIKRAIMDWNAIPLRIRTDRGSGYINKTIQSACALMEIELKACQPGDPRAKGFIERIFGTFTREMSPIIPGFIGHNVAQAQKIRARNKKRKGSFSVEAKVTCAEFQAILDAWVIGEYEPRIHGTTREAPLMRAMRSPVPVRPAPSADILTVMLSAQIGMRVVRKQGINWEGKRYWHPSLAAWIGQPVHVRRDEGDLGALFILDDAGELICTALNYERAGFSERDYAIAMARKQRQWAAEVKAEKRRIEAGFSIEDANAAIMRDQAEAAGKLAYMRPAAAAPATDVAAPMKPRRNNVAQLVPAKVDASVMAARAEGLIEQARQGFAVDETRLRWARSYVESAAYAAHLEMQQLIRNHQGQTQGAINE